MTEYLGKKKQITCHTRISVQKRRVQVEPPKRVSLNATAPLLRARLAWMTLRFPLFAALLALTACAQAQAPARDSGLLPPGARGIDLSHHNGPVNWDALEAENLDFIYLKATEGRDWKDEDFQSNWIEATRRGYNVGAYHFYILCKPAAEQAINFIQSVEVRSGTLPPAVDLEYAHNCKPYRDEAGTKAELKIFLDSLETEYGATPVIYTTPEFHADWIAGSFDRYPLWIRSVDGAPDMSFAIWQHSMRGKVAGIAGDVDLNMAAGGMPED
jgi:lysozyme